MNCYIPYPKYANQPFQGIAFANNIGDGYSIAVNWFQAWSPSYQYQVVYNIYYSTNEGDLFDEGPKFVVLDPNLTSFTLTEFTPGDTYFFAIRASLLESSRNNLAGLPQAANGLKTYPEAILTSNINLSDTVIPITDIETFPAFGIIQVGHELIYYNGKDLVTGELVGAERGFYDTNIRIHDVDGYDGYYDLNPIIHYFYGFDDANTSVLTTECKFFQPNYPYTNADGYKLVLDDVLTTDFTASDADHTDFPPIDHSGYHADPVDVLSGKCIGSYIFGEIGCADGYGNVNTQLRGPNPNTANNQREEELLNIDGEPFVLMKRLWTGTVCYCMDSNRESTNPRCPSCFVPGTLVKTELGWRPIEQIKIGEKVLSSDGYYYSVTKTFENQYNGKLKSISTSTTANPILVTPEHPFLVLRGEHSKTNHKKNGCGPKCDGFIEDGDGITSRNPSVRLLPSGKWWARVSLKNGKRKSLGTFETKELAVFEINKYKNEQFKPGHTLDWNDAEEIKTNDWLVSKCNYEVLDIESIDIPQEFLKNTNLGMQRLGSNKFYVDNEFLWMIGLYLAEGSCGSREIVFSLHKKEIVFQNRLVTYFEKHGYNVSINDTSENGVCVRVCSTTLAEWFPKLLGTYCYNKKIPENFMKLPNEKTWALIRGIHDGDGSKRDKEIGQTSEILALQLVELLHRVGEQPLIRRQKSKILTPKGNERKLCYIVSWAEDTATHANRKGRWNFKKEILTKVNSSIDIDNYCGMVYNLEVDGNHTYVVQGIVVHNCFGTGFVSGYVQYHFPRRSDGRIMIRIDPTVEDLIPQDSGLESTFSPNAWTLTVPAIKDRDFLVRFLADDINKEEFRYEVLRVTRNKLLLNQFGNQKLELARIRKTDPIYQVPVFRNTATMPRTITTGIGFMKGPGGILIPHVHALIVSETITSITQINQMTEVSQNHNHYIINGVVNGSSTDAGLNHTHSIVLV